MSYFAVFVIVLLKEHDIFDTIVYAKKSSISDNIVFVWKFTCKYVCFIYLCSLLYA